MQELMRDNGLHVLFGPAVTGNEVEVHEQARTILAGHRKRRNTVVEGDVEDLEHRPHRKRVVVDELVIDAQKMLLVHW